MELCMCTAREEIISISNFSDSTIKRLRNTWMKSFTGIKLHYQHLRKMVCLDIYEFSIK